MHRVTKNWYRSGHYKLWFMRTGKALPLYYKLRNPYHVYFSWEYIRFKFYSSKLYKQLAYKYYNYRYDNARH